MFKRILIIANKGAGGEANDMAAIKDLLDDAGITYDVSLLSKEDSMSGAKAKAKTGTHDAIIAYGGDGSVLATAHALVGTDKPLLILPGGTANALAASLGHTMSAKNALRAFIEGRYTIVKLDVAFADKQPIVFDFHYGLVARTVRNTNRALKQKIGILAYLIEGIRQVQKVRPQEYEISMDGQVVKTTAVLCYIANSGLPKLLGVRLFARKRAVDRKVDVALCKTTNPAALLWWLIRRAIFGRGSAKVVALYRAQEVKIVKAPRKVFCDDQVREMPPPIHINVQAEVLKIIMPKTHTTRERFKNAGLFLETQGYRFIDQLRRIMYGISYRRFSQLSDTFFIGGQPNRRGMKSLERWGVTAIVSLREQKPRFVPKHMRVLHLPTRDRTPIALYDIQRGVAFIQQQIDQGGKVYVHCHVGEGRSASLVIAYLLSQGMFMNDALAYIKKHRVFIRPNKKQLARLRAYTRELQKGKLKAEAKK